MQSKKEIEDWYSKPDPWGYKVSKEDENRKHIILSCLDGKYFKRALDIGCGEGWITTDLLASEIFGYEISDTATSRFPSNIKRVTEPEGYYDLMLATGVMYPQYDFLKFINIINKHASGTVILCNIKDWEVTDVKLLKNEIYSFEFNYKTFVERIRIYDYRTNWSGSSR